ncbi:MAG: hypothetical protein ACO3YY_08735, partial [Phycisphaerales bacterium]
MSSKRVFIAAMAASGIASAASADVVISQGDSAPTYATTLNFDEPGQATGPVPSTYWQADYGIVIDSGDGNPVVDAWGGIFGPWLGDGNSFFGNFGVFITFDNDVTAFSAQVWDPSGPPSPIGGGLIVAVWNDGVEVTSTVIEPAWGTDVGSWLDIVGDGGTAFDEVRFVGLGFDPSTFTDNLSWTPVPAPGAIALLGLAGLAGRRRRDCVDPHLGKGGAKEPT